MTTLTDEQVERFVADGFVRVDGAFPVELAEQARSLLWRKLGMDPADRSTWTKEVVRIGFCSEEPFVRSANTPRLHAAYDQLVGPGRWVPPSAVGTFPVRFPGERAQDEPEDFGWHIDAGFLHLEEFQTYADWRGELELVPPNFEETFRVNLWSRGRALLMLFLYSDTDESDAPTLVRVGSHLDVPPLLAPAGEAGLWLDVSDAGAERPLATATGRAGDVYLCHPFLVHTPQSIGGTRPRFMAQPGLQPTGQLELDRPDGRYTPVERAVRRGLGLPEGARA